MSERRRKAPVTALAALILAEAALMLGATALLVSDLLAPPAGGRASVIALLVLSALSFVWLVVLTRAVWLGRSWVRAAVLVWQVVLIAVAVGSFQGDFARPDIGAVLLVPAVAVVVLLFTPEVLRHTQREE